MCCEGPVEDTCMLERLAAPRLIELDPTPVWGREEEDDLDDDDLDDDEDDDEEFDEEFDDEDDDWDEDGEEDEDE